MNTFRRGHERGVCTKRGATIVSRRRTAYHADDSGFSLIELLVVVAILPLVIGAISVALLTVFSNENAATNSLTSSSDAQVASAAFVQDVQSAVWITTVNLDVCGGAPAGAALIVSLSPDNLSSGSIQNIISYFRTANSGSTTYTITRVSCTGGIGSAASSSVVVAHNTLYDPATTFLVVPSSVQSAASGGWVSASGASKVTLTLNEPASNHVSTGRYAYTLSATPRPTGTGGASPGGVQPLLPLQFLGGTCPVLQLTGGSSLVNSENGSGTSGSGFVGFASSQSNCTNPTNGNGTLNADTPYEYGVSDPLASLPPPTTPSTSGLQAGICTSTTCNAGLYGAGTFGGYNNGNLSGVTIDPSIGTPTKNIVVFTVPVTIKNTNVTFDGSSSLTNVVYWFQQGLTISTGANVTFGSATYIFGTIGGSYSGNALSIDSQSSIGEPNGSAGLIFYVEPGSATASLGSGVSGSILGSSSPYDGVAIWDAATAPSGTSCSPQGQPGTLNFGQGNGGGTGISASFGGIYDPKGVVCISGNYSMQAQFMIVNTATVQTSTVTMTG
jgi:prepilin-type N-terminal cleavage/methylation domain-containing protein